MNDRTTALRPAICILPVRRYGSHRLSRLGAGRAVVSFATAGALIGVTACGGEDTQGPPPPPGPQNQAPVADAGPDLTVSALLPVGLDGSGSSDADGDALTYQWSLTSTPSGSAAALDDPSAATPSFVPDLIGAYAVQLVVSDGTDDSDPDVVTVDAQDNTASATIGPGGGDLEHTDGVWSMSIPSGGLGEDTEFRVTLVPPDQYPEALRDFAEEDEARVYQVEPAGIRLTAPATIRLILPDPAVNPDGDLETKIWAVAEIETGEPFVNQVIDLDPVANRVVLSAETPPVPGSAVGGPRQAIRVVEYSVSSHVNRLIRWTDDGGSSEVQHLDNGKSRMRLFGPPGGTVAAPFPVTGQILAPSLTDQFETGLTGRMSMSGVGLGITTTETYVAIQIGEVLLQESVNQIECQAPGDFDLEARSRVRYDVPVLRALGPEPLRVDRPFELDVRAGLRIACLAGTGDEPFEPVSAVAPEEIYQFETEFGEQLFVVGRRGGFTLFNQNGSLLAEGDGVPDGSDVLGVHRLIKVERAGSPVVNEAIIALTNKGVFGTTEPIPSEVVEPVPSLTLAQFGQLLQDGISDNLDLTPDATSFGGDPDAEGALIVQTNDKNIVQLIPGDNGQWIVDPVVQNAFFFNDQPIFGELSPMSAFAVPGGFGPDRPLIALAVHDADGKSTLQHVALDEDAMPAQAVLTPVTDVGIPDFARKVGCVGIGSSRAEPPYFCGASSVGPPGGFGGMTFFTWDGQGGFTFVIGVVGTSTIGFDLLHTGDRIVAAISNFDLAFDGQDFSYMYRIVEFMPDGSFSRFQDHTAPDGCEAPGHLVLRTPLEVMLSCFGSDVVMMDRF